MIKDILATVIIFLVITHGGTFTIGEYLQD